MSVLDDDDFDESLLLAVDQWEAEYIARSGEAPRQAQKEAPSANALSGWHPESFTSSASAKQPAASFPPPVDTATKQGNIADFIPRNVNQR